MIEKIKNNLIVVSMLLGFFAFVTIFFPAVYVDMDKIMGTEFLWNIEGLKVVFGMEMMDYEVLEFSFFAFMAYLLPLVGCVLIYYADKKNDKNYWIGSALCFVVGAILLFLMTSLLVYGNSEAVEEFEKYIELGSGAIAGAISSLLAAACLVPTIKKFSNANTSLEQNLIQ